MPMVQNWLRALLTRSRIFWRVAGVCAAECVRHSVCDVVQETGLYDGEHEASDRKGHHQDRDQREHREVGGRCGEL